MIDTVDIKPASIMPDTETPTPKVNIETLFIGPVSPIDINTGKQVQPATEQAEQANEVVLKPEGFRQERQFMQGFLGQIIDPNAIKPGLEPIAEKTIREQVQLVRQKLATGEDITSQDLDVLKYLQIKYPPALVIEGDMKGIEPALSIRAMVESYFQTGTKQALEQGQDIKRSQAELTAFQEEASRLGLLTVDQQTFAADGAFCQLVGAFFEDVLEPEEIAQFFTGAYEGRQILTPADLDINNPNFQAMFLGFKEKTISEMDERKTKDKIQEKPVFRLFAQEKLQAKLQTLNEELYQKKIQRQDTAETEAQIRKVQARLNVLERKGDQFPKAMLAKLKSLYTNLPNQPEETVKTWFSIFSSEALAEDLPNQIGSLLKLLGFNEEHKQIQDSLKPGFMEKATVKGLKIGKTIGLISLAFILMQFYLNSMQDGTAAGGGQG